MKRVYAFDSDWTIVELDGYVFSKTWREALYKKTGSRFSEVPDKGLYCCMGHDYDSSVAGFKERFGIDDFPGFIETVSNLDFERREPLMRSGDIHIPDENIDMIESLRLDDDNEVIMITNSPGKIIDAQLRHCGAQGLFHKIYAHNYYTPDSKPRPHSLNHHIRTIGANPRDCWMVGDIATMDVACGKAANTRTGWLRRKGNVYPTSMEPPDLVRDNVVELINAAKNGGFDEMQMRQ